LQQGHLNTRSTPVSTMIEDNGPPGYIEMVNALEGMGSYNFRPKKLDHDLKNRAIPLAKSSVEVPPTISLKFPESSQACQCKERLRSDISRDLGQKSPILMTPACAH
ncbi:hypothetical protein HAX54_035931, partial [Datura stramonium]|nr:hypothetical protein [Datura stramonium]